MTPLAGAPVLTAREMAAAIAAGASVATLMARAGEGIAGAVRRLAAGGDVLILCGPGNNGGDGYVAAAALARAGVPVRVAADADPVGAEAAAARSRWQGPLATLRDAGPAAIMVDALYGTGLSRPLDGHATDELQRLAKAARLRIAVDVPSGLSSDDGAVLSEPPRFDVTLALGAAKPAHLLQPAARYCGTVRMVDIGVIPDAAARVIARPLLADPGPDSHKYNRGMVAVVPGAMAGAGALAGEAAMRAGAGYVLLLTDGQSAPHAIVKKAFSRGILDDARIGAVVIGPGLGRDDEARGRLDAALASGRPLVIDGDALHLVSARRLRSCSAPVILTPHAGEFKALFGDGPGSKIDRALAAAAASGATVVFKGADTVIAAPDGEVRLGSDASDWLSTAGSGDVLAGIVGAMLAGGLAPLDAAAAAVWLHGDAARRLGAAFLADDLVRAVGAARAAA